jgi:glycosyltransferase involved in cell wall biosynthesis
MSSDDPEALSARIREFKSNPAKARKHRLAGVRKVMTSHTYRDRFSYVWEKVTGVAPIVNLPRVLVVSRVSTREQTLSALANYQRQNYERKQLVLVEENPSSDSSDFPDSATLLSDASHERFGAEGSDFVAALSSDDFYGPNYLVDLMLGTTYSDASVVGKAAYFASGGSGQIKLDSEGSEYRPSRRLALRRALVQVADIEGQEIAPWSKMIRNSKIVGDGLAIDEFNYCENGQSTARVQEIVGDLDGLDTGVHPISLRALSEAVAVADGPSSDGHVVDASHFYSWFEDRGKTWCSIAPDDNGCRVASKLPEGDSRYLWTKKFPAEEVLTTSPQPLFLDAGQGLDLKFALRFLDENEAVVGSSIIAPHEQSDVDWPPNTRWIVPGLRLSGSGEALVRGIYSDAPEFGIPVILPRGSHLVVTNIYPDQGALYRNAFVHRRMLGYRERSVSAEVLRFRTDLPPLFGEFEGVDVATGSERVLGAMLRHDAHESVMVHFLDEDMWATLRDGIGDRRLIIFVHGFEIQPLHRRSFDIESEDRMNALTEISDRRTAFWKRVFDELPETAHIVFVSQYLADQVMDDLDVTIPPETYSVIHNPIDTRLFEYRPKPPEQRLKILTIRPFTSRTYANDLSVEAILRLSGESWFDRLQIRVVGEGKLFKEVVAPLREFPNVTLDNRFLRQSEIAALHKEYGIFLCPTRMDTHGVSRDEAMASGLVPITTNTAAVPEFVDDSCGFMAPAGDSEGLADAIRVLVDDPQRFEAISAMAAARVRAQAASEVTIPQELALIGIGDAIGSGA